MLMKLLPAGRIIFGLGMLGLALLCAIHNDFIVGRPPAWNQFFTNGTLVGYVTAVILATCSLTIVAEKKVNVASMIIGVMILLLSLTRQLTLFSTEWLAALKTVSLIGGAIMVAAAYAHQTFRYRGLMITTGSMMLSAFFIAGGYAHFKFADFVEQFIPAYIPFRIFWTYFCGICLIAGGIGIHVPYTRKLASLLCGIMVMGWFLLLHIPRLLANTDDLGERLGFFESFTFAGIFFVLTGLLSQERKSSEINAASHFFPEKQRI